ncbi:hypothetical protein [uncultured Actinomyces sp.]|uniref:hypothetical protein n=1 Tax=uncultured Actinomyces sp. TaxID=249061 RepID=UPI0028E3AE5C|nr:hypothetical protein [uncultured Actinomyces sp.]
MTTNSPLTPSRILNPRRYLCALVTLDPHQAVARCVDYWASRWRCVLEETPGMSDQLAQRGWVGTEIADGSDSWRAFLSPIIDPIARSDLFTASASQPMRSTRRQTSRIMVAARSRAVGGRPASELWCFDTRVGHRDTPATPAVVGQFLQDFALTFQVEGLLLEEPRFFFGGDLPKDHPFAMDGILTMRRAAKQSIRRKNHA